MFYRFALIVLLAFFLHPFTVVRSDDLQQVAPACDQYISPWQKVAAAPSAHLEGATAVVNGKLFIIAGFKNNNLQVTGRVDVYNPQTKTWETAANSRKPLPAPLSHSMAAVVGDSIWMAGGFKGDHPGPATDEVWRYDTVLDEWFSGPKLPEKRAGGALAKVGQNLHYLGGTASDRDTTYDNHWILDLNNLDAGWKDAPALPQARIHLSAAATQGNLYAIGGQIRHDHDPVDLKSLYQFNPTTNSWSTKADLPSGRSHFEPGTLTYDGSIIIVGGRANQNGYGFGQLNWVTLYDTAKNKWCELRALPLALIAPHAARIGNQLIVTGGGSSWNVTHQDTYISTFINQTCKNDFGELLTNGCFETTTEQSLVPANWTVKNSSTAKVVCNSQKSVALEGHCAFQFKGSNGAPNKLSQKVNLADHTFASGDTLTLQGYVNAKKATANAKIVVKVVYSNGNAKSKITTSIAKTDGYQPLSGQLTTVLTSGSIQKIVINVKNKSPNGKIFVDALSLRQNNTSIDGLIPLP